MQAVTRTHRLKGSLSAPDCPLQSNRSARQGELASEYSECCDQTYLGQTDRLHTGPTNRNRFASGTDRMHKRAKLRRCWQRSAKQCWADNRIDTGLGAPGAISCERGDVHALASVVDHLVDVRNFGSLPHKLICSGPKAVQVRPKQHC